ncbi:MAG: hypothetical protein LBE13_17685 [Bacteroidales bacterium]|jgi:hypothetical protein|nr:hypothetical protein [Bacteroidales bacterium]
MEPSAVIKKFNLELFLVYGVFLCMSIYFQIKNPIQEDLFFIQVIYSIIFLTFFFTGIQYSVHSAIIIILCYQILGSIFFYFYYNFYLHSPFGFDPVDSLLYQRIAEETVNISINKLLSYLQEKFSPSDWGYNIYKYCITRLVGDAEDALFVICMINACLHTISSYYLYKLAKYFVNPKEAIVILLLWGLSVTSLFFNTCGLKETLFLFLIILSVYHLYAFYKSNNRINKRIHFILMGIFIVTTWFFRYYISLFIILTFIGCVPLRKIYNKYFPMILLSIFLVCLFGLNLLFVFMPELSYVITSLISNGKEVVNYAGGNLIVAGIINYTLAFLSPIPAFSAENVNVNLLVCTYSIIKVYFSFFGLYGIYHAIKINDISIYPIITILVFNIVLCIVASVSLDFRFAYPTTFLYIILIVYGFNHFSIRKNIQVKKTFSISVIRVFIFFYSLGLTYVYNV